MYRETHNPEIVIPERYIIDHVIADNRAMSAMEAFDQRTEEKVFVKSRNPLRDKYAAERIANEAEIRSNLDHPQIPGFRHADPDALHPYIVTDLAESDPTVERRFKDFGDPPLAAELVGSALVALDHVHGKKIAHCDIKPGNLLMTWDETAVTDFDIARRIGGEAISQALFGDPDTNLATLQYASPEQLRGEQELDARSDVYSMGRVLLYFLSGKPPVTGEDASQVAARRIAVGDSPRDLFSRDVPAGLLAVTERALQTLPGGRYASAGEMSEDLERWVRDNVPAAARAPELIAA